MNDWRLGRAPTVKQVDFYRALIAKPVFTDREREHALRWLEQRATRNTIKDQIDWLKRQVESRQGKGTLP